MGQRKVPRVLTLAWPSTMKHEASYSSWLCLIFLMSTLEAYLIVPAPQDAYEDEMRSYLSSGT